MHSWEISATSRSSCCSLAGDGYVLAQDSAGGASLPENIPGHASHLACVPTTVPEIMVSVRVSTENRRDYSPVVHIQ